MKTVIMAGGQGKRLVQQPGSAWQDLPKPLVPVAGVPILEREIDALRQQGFTDIIMTVSYLGDAIEAYFGDGNKISPVTGKPFGVQIKYFREGVPLGNAGALLKLRDELTEDFLLLNADMLFDVDLSRFEAFHSKHGGLATLFAHPNSHPYDSGLLVADEEGCVTQWLTKEEPRPKYYSNRINAGLHILSPQALDICGIAPEKVGIQDDVTGKILKVDLDRNILKPLAGSGKMFCYDSSEYVKDMGTPERHFKVEQDLESGLAQSRNLKNKQRAIFLDRDGTINRYNGYVTRTEDFELLPGVAEAIRNINNSFFLCIVITNQPVVARGELAVDGLEEIHHKMETLLGQQGAYVDALYYCPHHPDRGFPGEVPELKIKCDCRKPDIGLVRRAAEKYNIALESSWFIGDSWRDIGCGNNANMHTCLLTDGEGVKQDWGQEITCSSLLEAMDMIFAREEVQ